MSDIRGLLSKMDKAGNAERKRLSGQIRQQIQIVERGVGGVAKGENRELSAERRQARAESHRRRRRFGRGGARDQLRASVVILIFCHHPRYIE